MGNPIYIVISLSVSADFNSMISFIIPAFNEERLLGRTLEAIQKAAKNIDNDYELIVVDDNSSDIG